MSRKRRGAEAAFAVCDELPALVVSGAALFIADRSYHSIYGKGRKLVISKASVLDCLRLANQDFKRAVDAFAAEWMREAVGRLQRCREQELLDRKTGACRFLATWCDVGLPWLAKMLAETTVKVLKLDLQGEGACTSLGTDASTFISLLMSRCQLKACGMCKCKGANQCHLAVYESEGTKRALFARRSCVLDSCVAVGPLCTKADKGSALLASAMLRKRGTLLPRSKMDFLHGVGTHTYTHRELNAFGDVLPVCKHPALPGASVQERLRITHKELAECKADVERRRVAKERRVQALRDMVVSDALADVDAALASDAALPVDSIDALTELCAGMGTRLRKTVAANAAADVNGCDSWCVNKLLKEVAFFLQKVLERDRSLYRSYMSDDQACSSAQAYDFMSQCDLALYKDDTRFIQRTGLSRLDPCACALAMHFFDEIDGASLSTKDWHAYTAREPTMQLRAGDLSPVTFGVSLPVYTDVKLLYSAAKRRFPDKALPALPKRAVYAQPRKHTFEATQWTLSIFRALAADPDSRGMALYLVGISPQRLIDSVACSRRYTMEPDKGPRRGD